MPGPWHCRLQACNLVSVSRSEPPAVQLEAFTADHACTYHLPDEHKLLAMRSHPAHQANPICASLQVTAERRKWRRFGGVNQATEKDTGITARALEDIAFERVRPNKQTQEEKKAANIKQALQTSNNQTIVGRCGTIFWAQGSGLGASWQVHL